MHVCVRVPAAWRDPLGVLEAFAGAPWALAFLSQGGGPQARWSYLARDPDAVLVVDPADPADPFPQLDGLLGPPAPTLPEGPPFQGGLAGLLAYEFGDRVERLGLERMAGWPDLAVGRYLALLAFDHARGEVWALGRGEDGARARARAEAARGWLDLPPPAPRVPPCARLVVPPAGDFEAAVAEVVERIAAGDLFQANLARAWAGRLAGGATPFSLLARLAEAGGAPFAAYLHLGGLAVVSNSPERFLQTDAQGRVETRPIKGTRPRGADAGEDEALRCALRASLKDRAENLMIVDLMRNDLARVCRPGSVRVPDLFQVESFAHVHHLVSTVTGRLQDGLGVLDLIRAAFPPGSVTGAPKVEAMKTIARLEPPRGPYCGSMFWAGFDGAMDSSVLIRTAACRKDLEGWTVEVRAGAGLVADSEPVQERLETEAKAKGLLRALSGTAP